MPWDYRKTSKNKMSSTTTVTTSAQMAQKVKASEWQAISMQFSLHILSKITKITVWIHWMQSKYWLFSANWESKYWSHSWVKFLFHKEIDWMEKAEKFTFSCILQQEVTTISSAVLTIWYYYWSIRELLVIIKTTSPKRR